MNLRQKIWLIPLLGALGLLLNATEPEPFWSGCEIRLPGAGAWQLRAEHGRLLASGVGNAVFQIDALTPGTALDAVLERGGTRRSLRFFAPVQLNGLSAASVLEPRQEAALKRTGLRFTSEATGLLFTAVPPPENEDWKTVVVLPGKTDLPLELPKDWQRIFLFRAKKNNGLSVSTGDGQPVADRGGSVQCVKVETATRTLYLFAPDFNPENLDDLLLLKQFLKEKQ